MSAETKIALLITEEMTATCFDHKVQRQLKELGWSGQYLSKTDQPAQALDLIKDAQIAITSWGSPQLTADYLDAAGNLRLVTHAAGSVKPIVSDELWQRGVHVTSAASAISIGVGEHALGLMLSAMKNCYAFNQLMKNSKDDDIDRERIVEAYGITVGVIGCGFAGKRFIELCRNFELNIVIYDPFLSDTDAAKMGAAKADLDTLLSQSDVVSIHAPQLPQTHHMLNAKNLPLLKDRAILINTARGSIIDEDALIKELRRRPIIAALDVTDPEPPAADSPLRQLPNVILTPHIAGAAANNKLRLGQYALNEIKAFLANKPLHFPVKQEDLARIA